MLKVLLLVDKQEYDTNNEVVVYVPTSHVLMHDADMLGLQLLTYYGEDPEENIAYANESCWHDKPGSAIIHTQNVTFTKYPGQNIRGNKNKKSTIMSRERRHILHHFLICGKKRVIHLIK